MTDPATNPNLAKALQAEYHETQATLFGASEQVLADRIGDIEERYGGHEFLAEGGMKRIYRVYDRLTERDLAMANLPLDASTESRELFLREAKITAALQHPNVMPIHDVGVRDDGTPFFTMKLMEGGDLATALSGNRDQVELLAAFLKICDAVAFAHSQGILHLDLKPANVQIGRHGEVIVSDWGVAKILYSICDEQFLADDHLDKVNAELTIQGRGTPGFMAPEQVCGGALDQRTDVYALGCLLFTVITGSPPFDGIVAKGEIAPPSRTNPTIAAGLDAVCLKALRSDPADRYESVEALADDVSAYLRGFAPKAEDAGFLTHLRLLVLRHQSEFAVLCTCLLIMAAGLGYFILQLQQREAETSRTLEQLLAEREAKVAAQKESGKSHYEQARSYFKYGNFDAALLAVSVAFTHDPADSDAAALKSVIHLIRIEFDAACNLARDIGGSRTEFVAACERLASAEAPYPPSIYLSAIGLVREFGDAQGADRSMLSACLKHAAIHGGEAELIVALIREANPGLPADAIFCENGVLRVHSGQLTKMPALMGSSLNDVDLSNSRVTNTRFLRGVRIERLWLANTGLSSLAIIQRGQLTDLNVAGSKLAGLPGWIAGRVRQLNIADCQFDSYEILLSFRELERLTLSRGQVPQEILTQLDCKIVYQ